MNVYLTVLYDLNANYPYYQEMHRLSTQSVQTHVADIGKSLTLTNVGKTRNPFQMLREVFIQTYEAWNHGQNNVLFIEIDALAIKPVRIFGEFTQFMMFSPTSPARNFGFDPYLNSGVRYFPAMMTEAVWKIGLDGLKDYNETYWGYDQVLYNRMFYAQGIPPVIRSELNWCVPSDCPKSCLRKNAKILHFCSTRGAQSVVFQMKRELGVEL